MNAKPLILFVFLVSCSSVPPMFSNPQATESISTFIPPTINETPDTGISVTVNYEMVNIRDAITHGRLDVAFYGDQLRVRIQPSGWAVILEPRKWYGMVLWDGCVTPNVAGRGCE